MKKEVCFYCNNGLPCHNRRHVDMDLSKDIKPSDREYCEHVFNDKEKCNKCGVSLDLIPKIPSKEKPIHPPRVWIRESISRVIDNPPVTMTLRKMSAYYGPEDGKQKHRDEYLSLEEHNYIVDKLKTFYEELNKLNIEELEARDNLIASKDMQIEALLKAKVGVNNV